MSINIKRTIGGAVITAAIAGGVAFTAVAPASAATAEAGVVKAAVQGDRIQGPFVTRSNPWEYSNKPTDKADWNNWGINGQPVEVLTAPGDQKTAPTATKPTTIWSFPAVGTSGPIMNSAGQCLVMSTAPGAGPSDLGVGNCASALKFTIDPDGVIRYNTGYVTAQSVGVGYPLMLTMGRNYAETLDLSSLTPVNPPACTAGLTGSVSNVNQTAKSAVVGGTGKAGETITVSGGPAGAVTTVVGADGKWTATIPGLATGDNKLTVNSSDNCAPVSLSVIIDALEIPVVHPLAAAGAGVLGLGALLVGGLRRRTNAKA